MRKSLNGIPEFSKLPRLRSALQWLLNVRTSRSCALVLGLLIVCPDARPSELSAGTNVEVRLSTATGSRVSHVGDRLQATVIAPVIEGGMVVIPPGALLSGSVVSVHRLGLGLKHSVASIEFRFDSLQLPQQRSIPLSTQVIAVETAKERVNGHGAIGGIHPVANLSSAVSIMISTILMQPGIVLPVIGVKFLLVRSPDPEIYFPSGTEFVVQIKKAAFLPYAPARTALLPDLSPEQDSRARQLVDRMPEQQSQRGPNRPSDLVNIMFLGTQDAVERAFRAAGWTGAQAHNAVAVYRMFHCLVQRAAYTKAPMARLRLNGVPQQLEYQKSLDTFEKRHHIRLWKQDGSDAWLSAATEDVSFTVSKMHVTHASDQNIDNERAKVVNDLALTGCLDAGSVIPRDNLHVESKGKELIVTDGKIAVLRLNDCTHPVNVTGPEHHSVGSHLTHIAAVVGSDIVRSNPLSLSFNISNMILNREDAHTRTLQAGSRQQRKALATEALLSGRWKRASVVGNAVSLAGAGASISIGQ